MLIQDKKITQTCNIRKFGYEVWEWYTAIISLIEKLVSIQQIYKIILHPANEDKQILKDESIKKITFRAFVLRSLDFKDLKVKIDWNTLKSLIDLKEKDLQEIWITLETVDF